MLIIQNIQALRGFAALCVVLHHLSLIEQKYSVHQIIPRYITDLGIMGIDLFFVISGFIMATVTRGQFQSGHHARLFLLRRIIRIYPIYWFFTALALIAFFINPLWVNSSQNNQFDWLNSLFLLPSNILPLLNVGWTLIHEMYFYLVFCGFIWLFSERRLTPLLLGWAVIVIAANIYSVIGYNATTRLVFNPMTLEFIGGALLAIVITNPTKNANHWLWLVFAIIIIAAYFFIQSSTHRLFFTNPKLQVNAGDWRRVISFGLPSILTIMFVVYLEHKRTIFSRCWLALGDSSYSLYLSHILVLSACGKLWKIASQDSIYENYLVLPAILIIAITVGWLSYQYIEKPLMAVSKKYLASSARKQIVL